MSKPGLEPIPDISVAPKYPAAVSSNRCEGNDGHWIPILCFYSATLKSLGRRLPPLVSTYLQIAAGPILIFLSPSQHLVITVPTNKAWLRFNINALYSSFSFQQCHGVRQEVKARGEGEWMEGPRDRFIALHNDTERSPAFILF